MDDQRVAQALAIDQQRLEQAAQRFEIEVGHGEGHLHLEHVAERAQAGVEQDVADLGEHLARRRVDAQRQRRLVGQQLLERPAACMIEDQQRVAGHRAGENLVDRGDVLR